MRTRHNPWVPCAVVASILSSTVAGSASGGRGDVIYVDAAAAPGGNGSSWALAYDDLQDALAGAVAGDEIWVAAGTYTPTGPGGDRTISFPLESGVALYGGFAGWEQNLSERDWIANETILSGDLNGDDLPNFLNYGENSYHVLIGSGVDETAWLDGFTVRGGNADDIGTDHELGGGMFAEAGSPTIVNCTFCANYAGSGGGIYNRDASPVVSNCLFAGNLTFGTGGGIRSWGECFPIISDCSFVENTAAAGGGIANRRYGFTIINGCEFIDNLVEGGGGGIQIDCANTDISDCYFAFNVARGGGGISRVADHGSAIDGCTFIGNHVEYLGGGVMVGWCFSADDASAVDCLFVGNSSNNWGGGAAVSMPGSFVNCAFSRNSAVLVGGGAYLMAEPEAEPAFVNCTFSGNEGGGVGLFQSEPALVNCVSWGNTPGEILVDPESWPCVPTISFSDIQGGWTGPGANNIDADPLFVQPGMDNLRLGFGSPCVNAGDNAAVPPGILYDIYGVDRFIDGIVDMGACEGEYEQLPEGVIEYGLDPGDFAILVPSGGSAFDPPAAAGVLIVNVSGPDNATVQVLQFPDTQHPGAEGFASLGANLDLDTSMSNGQFSALVYIPFDEDDLGGADPLTVDLTYFDETVGNWGLAASHNTQNSPGHGGPIGDRIVVGSGGGWGITPQLGDYGVYWDPAAAAGFAWARVDFAGDFAFGWPLCPGDCHQPPDGVVNVIDLNAALAAWGLGAGPFDVNNDGIVNMLDILDLLAVWGVCP